MNWFTKLEKPHHIRDMELQTIHIGGQYSKVHEVTNFFPVEVYLTMLTDGTFKEVFYFDAVQDKVVLPAFAEKYKIYLLYQTVTSQVVELCYQEARQKYVFQQDLTINEGFVKLFSRCVVS